MVNHIEKGREGESLAYSYMKKRDFVIEHCNWRCSYHEIDIIATKNGIIHFVEVKTRHSLEFGYPEDGVTRKKFNNLKKAAEAYLLRFEKLKKIQFDILSILILPGKEVEYLLLEDVYMD